MSSLIFALQQSIYFFIPLMVVALGAMFSERSGVLNIALEGEMVMGAFMGVLFINKMQAAGTGMNGQALLLLALLIAGVSGALFTGLHAFAAIHLKADQTISATALNMIAPAACIFVARVIQNVQQVGFKNVFIIKKVAVLSDIPFIGPIFFQNTYITTFIGFGILAVATFVLYKTKFGLQLRACGEHPQAADSVGISVYKIRYSGVMISGFLGGVGGLIYVVPTTTTFDATVAGYGFLALAVLIFGQWKPVRIALSAFFFGFMKTIASAYSGIPFLVALGLPNAVFKALPYVATLLVLAFTSKNSAGPAAAGQPYDKGMR